MDKRLSWMVVAFGLVVIAGGVIAYVKASSTVSLLIAGPMGLVIAGLGILTMRGVPWARRAACIACAFVAAVMAYRAVKTEKVLPGAPVAALGLSLAAVLFRNERPAA